MSSEEFDSLEEGNFKVLKTEFAEASDKTVSVGVVIKPKKGKQIYVSRKENVKLTASKVLVEGMIDDELLTHFSYRIPTSSHQSGAILRVVGFLPEASGDLLIVPKEHTKQFGEDFDVDKRQLYKSNYFVDKEGKIRKLNYNNLEQLYFDEDTVSEIKVRINALKQENKALYEELSSLKESDNISEEELDFELMKYIFDAKEFKNLNDTVLEIFNNRDDVTVTENIDKRTRKTTLTFLDKDNNEYKEYDSIKSFVDEFGITDKEYYELLKEKTIKVKSVSFKKDGEASAVILLSDGKELTLYRKDNFSVETKSDEWKEFNEIDKRIQEIYGSFNLNKEDKRVLYEALKNETENKKPFNERNKREFEFKLLQNAMIDIYKSVYQTTDKELQNKINQTLAFEDIQADVDMIRFKQESDNADIDFSVASDVTQREMLRSGSSGKDATAIHSATIVTQGMLERLAEGNKVKFSRTYNIGGITTDGTMGNEYEASTSDDKRVRTIGNFNAQNQNSAVDNMKAGLMFFRNENIHTINSLVQMGRRGIISDEFYYTRLKNGTVKILKTAEEQKKFEEDNKDVGVAASYQRMGIPSFIISMPIIIDYAKAMDNNSSVLEADPKSRKDIENNILRKYYDKLSSNSKIREYQKKLKEDNANNKKKTNNKLEAATIMDETYYNKLLEKGTPETLYYNLTEETMDPEIQIAFFKFFMEMNAEGTNLTQYTSILNMSQGLGISYFNTIETIKKLNEVPTSGIANLTKLFGDFIKEDKFESKMHEAKLLPKGKRIGDVKYFEGYYLLGDYWIKPSTSESHQLIKTLAVSNAMMENVMPYNKPEIQEMLDTINSFREEKNRNYVSVKVNNNYEILNGLREFVYSGLNLFNDGISLDEVKKTLFFESSGNTSLAGIIRSLQKSAHPRLQFYVENNKLLNDLTGIVGRGRGKVSTVILKTGVKNQFTIDQYQTALLEMLNDNSTNLGKYNGQHLTPRLLAQKIIAYSFLAKDNQAVGLRQFVPQKYFEAMGLNENLRQIENNLGDYLGNFMTQYIQHNPTITTKANRIKHLFSKVAIIKRSGNVYNISYNDNTVNNLQHNKFDRIILKNDEEGYENTDKYPEFIHDIAVDYNSFDDNVVTDKYYLYKLDRRTGIYYKVPMLGRDGMNDYDLSVRNKDSIFDSQSTTKLVNGISKLATSDNDTNVSLENFIPGEYSSYYILNNFSNFDDFNEFRRIYEKIAPFLQRANVKVSIEDTTRKIKVGDETITKTPVATYSHERGTILLNPNALSYTHDKESPMSFLSHVLMEESIHALTVDELLKHIEIDEKTGEHLYKDENTAPLYVKNLMAVYKEAKNAVPNSYYTKNIKEFVAGVMMDSDFRKQLSEVKVNNMSLFERIIKAITNFLRYLTGSTYLEISENAVMDLINRRSDEEIINRNLIENNVVVQNDFNIINEMSLLTSLDKVNYLEKEVAFNEILGKIKTKIVEDPNFFIDDDFINSLEKVGLIDKKCN